MKALYVRARDGAQVSEDEALTATGALKDGYTVSGRVMMRDSASDQINVQDAISQVPWHLQSKLQRILVDLQSEWVNVRDDAIHQGHAVAASLKTIADGHARSPLIADSCLPACAVAAEHLYAQMAVARAKGPTVNDDWTGVAQNAGVKMKEPTHG